MWPDVSMMGTNNLRKVVGCDFHHMRKKYGVRQCSPAMAAIAAALRQLGRDGIRWRRERRDSLPTGSIKLEMIWRMKSGPITIGMRGESSGLPGTDYGDYVSLILHCSFLVRKESLHASITKSERKSMLSRYSFLEVSKKKKRKQVEDTPAST